MHKYLVTSALPYANGPIHLGHLAGAYIPADIFVRYKRLNGDDVLFICGSDEHGVPVTLRAEKEGVSPREIVDRFHDLMERSFKDMGIEFDNFSGTARPVHHAIASRFFLDLNENGHIMTKTEQQYYDEKMQRFLPDRYIEGDCPHCGYDKARGDQCDHCGKLLNALELKNPRSALSGVTPVIRETRHWYIRLQDFEEKLTQWIESKQNWKDNVKRFVLGWIRNEGLRERAITRDLSWGIPVPLAEAADKVLYVWFDAPIGYLSSTVEWAEKTGQPDKWKDYWLNQDCRMIHFIGKDNIPFHAIIWPAVLMGQNTSYILPYDVPANEYLTLEGEKISTSNNWAIWVHEYLADFPADPLRYFLASNAPESKDADFSWKSFQARNNDELANILGNFANRTLTFVQAYNGGFVPSPGAGPAENTVFAEIGHTLEEMLDRLGQYKVREASKLMMDIARAGNRYFDEQKPWVLKKEDTARLDVVLYSCLEILRILSVAMYPFIPFSALRLWKMLGQKNDISLQRWKDLMNDRLSGGQKISEPEILFVKYEDKLIQTQLDKLLQQSRNQTTKEKAMEEISIEDFQKVDLRVAEILSAQPLEKSKKLLKLKVKVGDVEKQILAGIKEFYDPDNLVGKKIIIVNNLKPAKLMGEESQGMLLAASNADKTTLSLLRPEKEMDSGSRIS